MSGYARVLGTSTRIGIDPATRLFPEQLRACRDQAKRVAMLCGRRSGKSIAFLVKAAMVMRERPGVRIPYIALTRGSAENILWNEAVALNERLQLGWVPSKQKLSFTAPNGSVLFLVGANKSDEVEKLRGQPFMLIGIDEAASFRPTLLKYLIDDVLRFALMDFDGALWVFGTPGAACMGFFHDVTTKRVKGWSVHAWNAEQNPHIPHARAWMEREMKERGIDSWEHPTVQREFFGRWALDLDALVYHIGQKNLIREMPNDYAIGSPMWLHTFGEDFGVVNACAHAVWAYRRGGNDQHAYCVKSIKKAGLEPSEAADWLQEQIDVYQPERIMGDQGGIGKSYIEHARKRRGIQIHAADKMGKQGHIVWMNDALAAGRALILEPECQEWIEEARLLQWGMESVEIKVGGVLRHEQRKAEDPRFENDSCDASLYGWLDVYAHLNTSPPEPKRDPTRDRVDEEAEREDPKYAEPVPYWDVD